MKKKKLWGGRFKRNIDKGFERYQKSICCDWRLAEYDIYHSLIHVRALSYCGLLKKKEAARIESVLRSLLHKAKAGTLTVSLSSEDIHTDIQNKAEKKIGALAHKLHTLRSRNDQIVFDEKCYCFEKALCIVQELKELRGAFSLLARKYGRQVFPGYTHTRRAQAVSFSQYLYSYIEAFTQDIKRLTRYAQSLKIYIGAGALAGSAIPAQSYRKAIGSLCAVKKPLFTRISVPANTLWSVSDRDFILELLSANALIQMHLSRLAEDWILFSTDEFGLLDLPESFCTGSSLMPHKKNPDLLELIRGKTGALYAHFISLCTIMKGLPLTYNRDMQYDKEPLFDSVETLCAELGLLAKMVKGVRIKSAGVSRILSDERMYATELAEFLVREGASFKEAHTAAGHLIRYAEEKKKRITDLPDAALKTFHTSLTHPAVVRIMNAARAVSSRHQAPRAGKRGT